jgi:hypothetical protein
MPEHRTRHRTASHRRGAACPGSRQTDCYRAEASRHRGAACPGSRQTDCYRAEASRHRAPNATPGHHADRDPHGQRAPAAGPAKTGVDRRGGACPSWNRAARAAPDEDRPTRHRTYQTQPDQTRHRTYQTQPDQTRHRTYQTQPDQSHHRTYQTQPDRRGHRSVATARDEHPE